MYLPDWSDSSLIANQKMQSFAQYQRRMYDGMFAGFTDVPDSLRYIDYIQPWMDTDIGQVAALVNKIETDQANIRTYNPETGKIE